MLRLVVILLVCAFATACQRAPEASRQMDNYLDRVGRVLGQDWQAWDEDTLSQYRLPSRRNRMQPVPQLRLGMIDLVVESNQCPALQQTVAQRNSSLGKVMPGSHLLAYEGELLRNLDACMDIIKDDAERRALHQQLSEIADIKRASLPRAFWNALNASSEFEHYMRFDNQPLPVSQEPLTDHGAIDALRHLAEIGQALPARLPPTQSTLEPLFEALQRSDRSGQLIHSLARLNHTLDQATAMLRARAPAFLCPLGQPTRRSRTLLTVFTTFYAGEIQPQMAQAQRLGQPWQAAILQLGHTAEIPSATATYLQRLAGEERSLWERYQRSIQAHSEAWQDVLGACQQRPGQPGWDAGRRE
ncbi:DUF3080 domain-containing protein [Pseudomonas sp. gcc21]|uniref:DUF3080 family protein n=1 Tax=Pseudomonas sp. gcc21 TaxID=2726989 RepID=UPI001452A64B|nr:DUF3080 family protein [Pseudomonas sp. gcc21]QJD57875.1 DUF3080 domain-containing protein [Pseudomonas sp. gcc21]